MELKANFIIQSTKPLISSWALDDQVVEEKADLTATENITGGVDIPSLDMADSSCLAEPSDPLEIKDSDVAGQAAFQVKVERLEKPGT